jgi:hypothetical protein
MAMLRNLPKTTPNPMYGDENFLQSSPSVSPHASPQISASGSQKIGSFSSPARSPSPISLNSGSARICSISGNTSSNKNCNLRRLIPRRTEEPQCRRGQSNVTRYSEGDTTHLPAPRQFIALPSSPLPIRPGSSYSVYSRYSFYSAADLPSGSSTPQPGAYFENPPQTGDSSTRTPTPTQEPQQHLTTNDFNPNGSAQSSRRPFACTTTNRKSRQPADAARVPCTRHPAPRGEPAARVGVLLRARRYGEWRVRSRHAHVGIEPAACVGHGERRTGGVWVVEESGGCCCNRFGARKEKGERNAVKSELVLAIYEVGQCFFHGWGVETDKKMAVVSVKCFVLIKEEC